MKPKLSTSSFGGSRLYDKKLPTSNWTVRSSYSVDWRNNFFSIYVGNVHWKSSLGDLWSLFIKFGVVSDIFIPHKSEQLALIKGFKFCFVRFRKEAEALKALAASVVLFGNKLVVKEACKQTNRLSSSNKVVKLKSRSYKEALFPTVQQKPADVEVLTNAPPSSNGGFVSKDYDDVNLSPKKQSCSAVEKGLAIDIPFEEMEWLERSAVGRLRSSIDSPDSLSYIYEGLTQQGICVSVAKFSNSQAILTFADKEEMELFLQKHLSLFYIWFEELSPCCTKSCSRTSRCWVKIDNLPLPLWNVSFFRYFGELWGNLIQVAELSSKRLELDSTWIQLEVPVGMIIPTVFKEVINGCHLNLKISLVSGVSIPKPSSYVSSSSDSSVQLMKDSPAFILHRWVEEKESDELIVDSCREEEKESDELIVDGCRDEANLGVLDNFICDGDTGSDLKVNSCEGAEENVQVFPDMVCRDRQIVVWDGKTVENSDSTSGVSECSQQSAFSCSIGSELGDLVVDLSHFEAKDCEPLYESPFMLNRGLDRSRGFGGFNRGFLQTNSKHNWSWIKKPRSRRSEPKSSTTEGAVRSGDPEVENKSNSYGNLRKEAEKTLEV